MLTFIDAFIYGIVDQNEHTICRVNGAYAGGVSTTAVRAVSELVGTGKRDKLKSFELGAVGGCDSAKITV